MVTTLDDAGAGAGAAAGVPSGVERMAVVSFEGVMGRRDGDMGPPLFLHKHVVDNWLAAGM